MHSYPVMRSSSVQNIHKWWANNVIQGRKTALSPGRCFPTITKEERGGKKKKKEKINKNLVTKKREKKKRRTISHDARRPEERVTIQ